MDAILAAGQATEFLTGLAWGAVALVVGLLVSYVWRQVFHGPAPVIGLLIALAAWRAMSTVRETPDVL